MKLHEKLCTLVFLWVVVSPPRNNLLRGLNSAVPAGPDRCLESLPEIRKGSFYMHSLSILPWTGACCLLPESQVIHPVVHPYAVRHRSLALPRLFPTRQLLLLLLSHSSPEDTRQKIQQLGTLGLSALLLSAGVVLFSAILGFLSLLK